MILIVVPAFAHKELAEKMVPFLEDGQIIVLNPGRTGGALEFYNVLKSKGLKRCYYSRSPNLYFCFSNV